MSATNKTPSTNTTYGATTTSYVSTTGVVSLNSANVNCKYLLPCGWCDRKNALCTYAPSQTIVTQPGLGQPSLQDYLTISGDSDIPPSCKNCSNHPSNGGSGVCHCILGLPQVTC